MSCVSVYLSCLALIQECLVWSQELDQRSRQTREDRDSAEFCRSVRWFDDSLASLQHSIGAFRMDTALAEECQDICFYRQAEHQYVVALRWRLLVLREASLEKQLQESDE